MASVQKTWNTDDSIWIEEDELNRAKELIREHGMDNTTKILEILEEEMDLEPFEDEAIWLLVIAIREITPELQKAKRKSLPVVCMIPDCGCDGTSHP